MKLACDVCQPHHDKYYNLITNCIQCLIDRSKVGTDVDSKSILHISTANGHVINVILIVIDSNYKTTAESLV